MRWAIETLALRVGWGGVVYGAVLDIDDVLVVGRRRAVGAGGRLDYDHPCPKADGEVLAEAFDEAPPA